MKDYYTNDSDYKIGDRVKCFDYLAWQKVGHDVGNNSRFTFPAVIVKVYMEESTSTTKGHRSRPLAAIRWDRDGKLSKGHFLWALDRI